MFFRLPRTGQDFLSTGGAIFFKQTLSVGVLCSTPGLGLGREGRLGVGGPCQSVQHWEPGQVLGINHDPGIGCWVSLLDGKGVGSHKRMISDLCQQ